MTSQCFSYAYTHTRRYRCLLLVKLQDAKDMPFAQSCQIYRAQRRITTSLEQRSHDVITRRTGSGLTGGADHLVSDGLQRVEVVGVEDELFFRFVGDASQLVLIGGVRNS